MGFIALIIAGAAAVGGYMQSRTFVKRRLRYVEAVQKGTAPVIAGAAAAILVSPLAALPLITGATAIALGTGVGLGTHAGARDIRDGRFDD